MNTAVNTDAPFAGFVVAIPSTAGVVAFDAAGFALAGAGVTRSPGGVAVASPMLPALSLRSRQAPGYRTSLAGMCLRRHRRTELASLSNYL